MGFSLNSFGKKLSDYAGDIGRIFGTAADAVTPGDQSNWHRPAAPAPAPVITPVQRQTAAQFTQPNSPTGTLPFVQNINRPNPFAPHTLPQDVTTPFTYRPRLPIEVPHTNMPLETAKQAVGGIAHDTKDMAVNILRAAPQSLVRITNQNAGKKEFVPTTTFEKILYGDKPIGNLQNYGEENANMLNAIPGVNVDGSQLPAPLSLGIGTVAAALDLTPAGGAKKGVIKEVAKASSETAVRKAITKGLGEEANSALTTEMARRLAAEKDPAKVMSILKSGERPSVAQSSEHVAPMNEDWPTDGLPGAEASTGKPKVAWKEPNVKPIVKPKNNADVQEILSDISKTQGTAKVESELVTSTMATQAKKLGVKLDHGFINRYQTGKLVTPAEKKMGEIIKAHTDEVFNRQKGIDPEIDYRENYVPQTYSNFEKGGDGAHGFRTTTDAAKPRTFDTYAEAADYGYKAKHDTLDKMLGINAGAARSAEGHAATITKGMNKGIFKTTAKDGGAPLTGFYSPAGEQLYAEKGVADVINGVMQRDTSGFAKTTHVAGGVSKTMQDIGLQGGVPGTNANFFVAGQVTKDTTRNIGKFALHPIQAAKQEGHLIADFFRGKNGTQKRFAANADFIREMADRGLAITHQSNLKGADENIISRNWDKLGNNPTFGRYMPNRLLSTAQEVYKQSVNKIGHDAALDLAAETTKTFNGIVSQVAKGRSNLTQDVMTATLFAPRYREAIVNALTNVVRSVIDPRTYTNKAYNPSREMLAGMMVTLYAYNKLNEKFNGHGMMDNPPGQETNLQIPYGDKDENGNQPVLRIPFMPGYLTIPRALWNAGSDIAHGDVKGTISEGGKMLSMPINTATALVGNKDYFGRPIYNDQATADANGTEADSGATIAKKAAGYALGQTSPAWVRAAQGVAAGKPMEQNLAVAAEAPVRFGKVTDPETAAYFDTHDKIEKSLNINERAAFNALHPAKKDAIGDALDAADNIYNPAARLDAYNRFPAVFAADKALDQLNRDQGKVGNPLFDLTPGQVKKVLEKDNLPPGAKDPELSNLYKQDWYAAYSASKSKYFTSIGEQQKAQLAAAKAVNTDKGREKAAKLQASIDKFDNPENPYPKTDDKLQKVMDTYTALPSGTGDRSKWIKSHPLEWAQMQTQFAKLDEWQNKQRLKRGLDETEGDTGVANGYGTKSKYGTYTKKPTVVGEADINKYAVSLNAGGTQKRGKASSGTASKPKVKLKNSGSNKPKVSIKKSMV
jgi:hypothetical protein